MRSPLSPNTDQPLPTNTVSTFSKAANLRTEAIMVAF